MLESQKEATKVVSLVQVMVENLPSVSDPLNPGHAEAN